MGDVVVAPEPPEHVLSGLDVTIEDAWLAKEDFDHAMKIYNDCKYDATDGAVLRAREWLSDWIMNGEDAAMFDTEQHQYDAGLAAAKGETVAPELEDATMAAAAAEVMGLPQPGQEPEEEDNLGGLLSPLKGAAPRDEEDAEGAEESKTAPGDQESKSESRLVVLEGPDERQRVKDTGGYSGSGLGPAAKAERAAMEAGIPVAASPNKAVQGGVAAAQEVEFDSSVRVGKRLYRRALRVPRVWRDTRGNLPRDVNLGTAMPIDEEMYAKALEYAEARIGVFRTPAEKAAAAEARRKADAALAQITEEEGKVRLSACLHLSVDVCVRVGGCWRNFR